jgi:hypothetical protein
MRRNHDPRHGENACMNDISVEPARAQVETPTHRAKPSDVSGRDEPQRSFRSHLERRDHDERGDKDQPGHGDAGKGDRPSDPGTDGAALASLTGGPELSASSFALRGPDLETTPSTQQTMARLPPQPQTSVNVDAALNQVAREVSLASDGRDAYMLRFEVAQGELLGTRIAVTSHGGVISAVVVPATPESTQRLEHALDAARLSLEARGIDVSTMEVRTGGDGHGQGHPDGRDETGRTVQAPGLPRGPATSPVARREPRGIDYFV